MANAIKVVFLEAQRSRRDIHWCYEQQPIRWNMYRRCRKRHLHTIAGNCQLYFSTIAGKKLVSGRKKSSYKAYSRR